MACSLIQLLLGWNTAETPEISPSEMFCIYSFFPSPKWNVTEMPSFYYNLSSECSQCVCVNHRSPGSATTDRWTHSWPLQLGTGLARQVLRVNSATFRTQRAEQSISATERVLSKNEKSSIWLFFKKKKKSELLFLTLNLDACSPFLEQLPGYLPEMKVGFSHCSVSPDRSDTWACHRRPAMIWDLPTWVPAFTPASYLLRVCWFSSLPAMFSWVSAFAPCHLIFPFAW